MTDSPAMLDRRSLLKGAVWTALGGLSVLALPPAARAAAPAPRWDRTLVLIHLGGGNDGLNTVVPFADPDYKKLRPRLAIAPDRVLKLDERLGLHPALEPLRNLWNDGNGDLAIGLGVGYPRQNRSHFRSIEIWQTASDAGETLGQGWIGRLFQANPPPDTLPADGVVMGGTGSLPLVGDGVTSVALPRSGKLNAPDLPFLVDPGSQRLSTGHVMGVQAALTRAVDRFKDLSSVPLPVEFPNTGVGKSLALVARMVLDGRGVPAVLLSQGGYDTHAGQLGTHDRLLGELAAALAAFRSALIAGGRWTDVAVMTFAEFGRRAGENASQGTDHGSASCHFVLGGGVRGGFLGEQRPLSDLSGGDLRHTLDFRSLYAGIAQGFWELPVADSAIAIGSFAPAPLFRGMAA